MPLVGLWDAFGVLWGAFSILLGPTARVPTPLAPWPAIPQTPVLEGTAAEAVACK